MANSDSRPVALKNAPLEYAPSNELGVVYLFANIARRLQFRIEEIRPRFPDCIAYRHVGDVEKKVRIEFEFRSSSFKSHKHSPQQCDMIVCWNHDWPDAPASIEVIELKTYFGVAKKIWIQQAIKSQSENIDKYDKLEWALSKKTTPGDILLMYKCHPVSAITDIYKYTGGNLIRDGAAWREGHAYFGEIRRICHLSSPIFLSDLQHHKVLRTASFVRRNMQGIGLQATEYWPYLYELITKRNPSIKEHLNSLRPDRL